MEPEIQKKKSVVREYVEALLTALLVAFIIRSFAIEAFKIPSGSMIPTLMIGDHIFVNKFIYGLRVPFTKTRLVSFKTPERGEAIVFMYPIDESKDFIKRVVGLPGDKLLIQGEDVFLNGTQIARQPIHVLPNESPEPKFLKVIPDAEANQLGVHRIPAFPDWENFKYFVENLQGKSHLVQFEGRSPYADTELEVPAGHLFVMGDNRDNSSDSREWGLVPIENVKGRAMFVWLSIDYDRKNLRWDRFGKWIN